MRLEYNTDTKEYRFVCKRHYGQTGGAWEVHELEQQDVADTHNPNECEVCGKRKSYGQF